MAAETDAGVDLYWLPLGAGGHFVRLNGRVFEAVAAWLGRRAPCDLYHSARWLDRVRRHAASRQGGRAPGWQAGLAVARRRARVSAAPFRS